MRGKKPKERDHYVLRIGGTLVDVEREVYLEWYQSRRRERYQQERNRKIGVYSLDELEEGKGNCAGMGFCSQEGVEEEALRNVLRDEVKAALGKISGEDAGLIELLYFKEITVTKAAEIYNCSRRTIQNRRKRILEELSFIMQEQGVQGD